MLDENGELKLAKDNITSDLENDSVHTLFNATNDFSEKKITLHDRKHSCKPSSCSLNSKCSISSYSCSNPNHDVITGNFEKKLEIKHPGGCNPLCTCCIQTVGYPSIIPAFPNSILTNKQSKALDTFLSNSNIPHNNSHLRHSLHLEIDHMNDTSSNLLQHYLRKEKCSQMHKVLSDKPPLPPRKRSFTKNYSSSDLEFKYLPLFSKSVSSKDPLPICINTSMPNCLENVDTNISHSSSKHLPPCLFYTICADDLQSSNTVESSHLQGIEKKDFMNETQRNLSHVRSDLDCLPFKNNDELSDSSKENRNIVSNFFDCNKKASFENSISLSPANDTVVSKESLAQKCSIPQLDLKTKTISKFYRIFPGPSPIPPPKGLPIVLAPLKSTEVLDKSRFWRMETKPTEPRAEIQHVRSRSYDFYKESKEGGNVQAKFSDRNKFSHYVNFEQIQIHLRKNMEQERLAKLASEQYQNFREKQTRRGCHWEQIDNQNLINKLEQKFIHESLLASREHRGYQSQRCPRENPYQQRPVSNYYEYESVQAVMNHAHGKPESYSSVLRRLPQSFPQNQMRERHKFKHTVAAAAQPHKVNCSQGTDNCDNNSFPRNKLLIREDREIENHSRGETSSSSSQFSREGVYAASGFRPASQYSSASNQYK